MDACAPFVWESVPHRWLQARFVPNWAKALLPKNIKPGQEADSREETHRKLCKLLGLSSGLTPSSCPKFSLALPCWRGPFKEILPLICPAMSRSRSSASWGPLLENWSEAPSRYLRKSQSRKDTEEQGKLEAVRDAGLCESVFVLRPCSRSTGSSNFGRVSLVAPGGQDQCSHVHGLPQGCLWILWQG